MKLVNRITAFAAILAPLMACNPPEEGDGAESYESSAVEADSCKSSVPEEQLTASDQLDDSGNPPGADPAAGGASIEDATDTGAIPARPGDGARLAAAVYVGYDKFGVARLRPTRSGGREWFLPATATSPDAEWKPGTTVKQVSAGVFSVSGAPRMIVASPAGKAWWRNVEMTSYVRQTGTVNYYADQVPHWTMYTRGEQHSNNSVSMSSISSGVRAPQGTAAWPGYPFASSVNRSCLASCYHGLFYPTGKFLLEKEITHTQGYTGARGQVTLSSFPSPMRRWVGIKYLLRNMNNNTAVKAEMWVDKNGDGNWTKVTEANDTGNWNAGNSSLNGCTSAPFRYRTNHVVTWAGPWAAFRMDNVSSDFKWLSVREIDPLP